MHFWNCFTKEDETEYVLNLIEDVVTNSKKMVMGYSGLYALMDYNHARIAVCIKINNEEKQLEILNAETHVKGSNRFRMAVRKKLMEKDLDIVVLCKNLEGAAITLPVSLFGGDCLPSLQEDDVVEFEGVGFLESLEITDSKKDAEKVFGLDEGVTFMGNELHIAEGIIMPAVGSSKEGSLIFAKIRGYRKELGIPDADSSNFKAIHILDVDTQIGAMSLVLPVDYVESHPEVMTRLENKEELWLAGEFFLSGNVLINKYSDGALHDEEHLLRLYKSVLSEGSFEKIEWALADDCDYQGYNGKAFKGKEAILDFIKRIHANTIKSKETIHHFTMATISKILLPERAFYEVGKRCYVTRLERDKGYSCYTFIECKDGKISAIRNVYDPTYEFTLDEKPRNPEEVNFDLGKVIPLMKTKEEWENFFSAWVLGKTTRTLEFYGKLELDCKAYICGEKYSGRETVFTKVKEYLDDLAARVKEGEEFNPEWITVEMSDKNRITKVEISSGKEQEVLW